MPNTTASHAATALALLLEKGLPHAVLLEGGKASTRTSFARRVAAAALCTYASVPQRPCGSCEHCVKATKDIHPDIITLGAVGGARSFHIDSIRQLRSQAYIAPNEGGYVVYILEDVQNLTVQAANALLKTLEEPPAHMLLVLTCPNRGQLLDTILSRVSLLSLGEDTSTPEATPFAQEAAALVQQLCTGQYYQALVALGAPALSKNRSDYITCLTAIEAHLQMLCTMGQQNPLFAPAQGLRLIALCGQIAATATQNVGLALVSAQLVAQWEHIFCNLTERR